MIINEKYCAHIQLLILWFWFVSKIFSHTHLPVSDELIFILFSKLLFQVYHRDWSQNLVLAREAVCLANSEGIKSDLDTLSLPAQVSYFQKPFAVVLHASHFRASGWIDKGRIRNSFTSRWWGEGVPLASRSLRGCVETSPRLHREVRGLLPSWIRWGRRTHVWLPDFRRGWAGSDFDQPISTTHLPADKK